MQFLSMLEGVRTPALTALFRFITLFGEETVAVLLLCLIYWCVDKELAFGMCIAFFVSALAVQGMKVAFRVDRPWVINAALLPVPEALASATGYSFPSGHTQTAGAVFGYLGLASGKRRWMVASWLLVLLVGFSRMYLGVHTPLDVIGALLIALAVSLGVLAYIRRRKTDVVLLSVLFAASLLVMVLAAVFHRLGHIQTKYLDDCFKAAGACTGCVAALALAKRYLPFDTQVPRLWQQLVKLLIGMVGLIAIQQGFKPLFGSAPLLGALRYFLIAMWALAVYPALFWYVEKRNIQKETTDG